MIDDEYSFNMILDNLPAALVVHESESGEKQYARGFPLGRSSPQRSSNHNHQRMLYNHIRFTVLYHRDERTDLSRIVGFEAEPMSIKHQHSGWRGSKTELGTCPSMSSSSLSAKADVSPQVVENGEEIVYTYDVLFKESTIKWASRWDMYLRMPDQQIHWLSVVNSLLILLFLTAMVAMILVRSLRRDISQYNAIDIEDAQEETGWKLLHGDVFRNPRSQSRLAVSNATGMQLLTMAFQTMFWAMLGFLSPANRGGLMTTMLILFALMGSVAGYTAGSMLREAGFRDWKADVLKSGLYFPSFVFVIFFLLNILVQSTGSSSAAPFGTLLVLCGLWFGVSVPLALIGGYYGFKKSEINIPVRTNKIPRQIPHQPLHMHPVITSLIGGLLPFGTVFIELSFILTSLWLHKVYYLFGILMIVFIILTLICAEISIVICYFQLCNEDYNWQWRSFATSSTCSLYIFAYCVYYYFADLELTNPVSTSLYFGYTTIFCVAFALMTGSIGFTATRWFVRTIYGSVKVD